MGKNYDLRFVNNLGDARGTCDPPDSPSKSIKIWRGNKGEAKLEVLIHEMIHAGNWSLDEEFIAQFAEDVARVLWKLGYRSKNDAEQK
jgi:hypothetical protein